VLNALAPVAPALAGRLAFSLFRSPLRRGKVRPTERAAHERAVTEELLVDGERVVSYRWGDGERPVLLLHGWRSRASRFAEFVPRLEAMGLSPVSFDAPGHGDSGGRATTIPTNARIAALLHDRYGTFHSVLAHSFGVPCAYLALREGVRAQHLVAVAGVSGFSFLFEEFTRVLSLSPRVGDGLRADVETRLFPGVDDPWQRFDATHEPDRVGVRTLIVHDEDDTMVPLQQAHRLMAAYGSHAELTVTSGLGHRRILTSPAVLDRALAFLGEQEGPGGREDRLDRLVAAPPLVP
jgi:pimeloyl-ACP methyl ester carboxylesterase